MITLPIGTKVQLSTGTPCPKRGRWVISKWMDENGQGRVEEIGADYTAIAIDARADGSPIVGYKRTQVIHNTDKRFTVTPL